MSSVYWAAILVNLGFPSYKTQCQFQHMNENDKGQQCGHLWQGSIKWGWRCLFMY